MNRGGIRPFSLESWEPLEAWEEQFDREVGQLEMRLIEIRRHLHAHPEPSGEEVATTRFVAEQLREVGLEPRICRNDEDGHEVGVVADLELGQAPPDAPLIAIRSDMDALRMRDEKQVVYASQNDGVAHACGHDVHATTLLGIALACKAVNSGQVQKPDFGVRLRLLFQPAEETSKGARWLVDQHALDGVDAILGMHVDPERLVGQVGVRYGVLTANCDELEIQVQGYGGHSARPHHTVDPIAAAAYLVNSLYKYLPRSVDSRDASVLTIGKIHGGYAPNVIPDKVELLGSLRTTEIESRDTLKKRIEEIRTGVELASGAKIEIRFLSPLDAVVNHPRVASALEEASRRVVGAENVQIIDRPSMGGEDFSVYLQHVPGALLRLGCAPPGETANMLHSPLFDVDERTLALGSRILLRAALLLSKDLNL